MKKLNTYLLGGFTKSTLPDGIERDSYGSVIVDTETPAQAIEKAKAEGIKDPVIISATLRGGDAE